MAAIVPFLTTRIEMKFKFGDIDFCSWSHNRWGGWLPLTASGCQGV